MIDTHQFASQRPSPLPSLSDEQYKQESNSGEECLFINDLTRRRGGRLLFHSMLMGAFSWQSLRQIAHADDGSGIVSLEKGITYLSGRINLPSGMNDPSGMDNSKIEAIENSSKDLKPLTKSALYVTARPNRPDNVPKAILDGSRGKSPPILAARFESPVFPFEFKLGEKDLTPEGAGSNNNQQSTNVNRFWWADDDLIVSARWDSDGVAATRSPEDLVGRNIWKQGTAVTDKNEGTTWFVLDLQGRGSFGKFATKKN